MAYVCFLPQFAGHLPFPDAQDDEPEDETDPFFFTSDAAQQKRISDAESSSWPELSSSTPRHHVSPRRQPSLSPRSFARDSESPQASGCASASPALPPLGIPRARTRRNAIVAQSASFPLLPPIPPLGTVQGPATLKPRRPLPSWLEAPLRAPRAHSSDRTLTGPTALLSPQPPPPGPRLPCPFRRPHIGA
jgi:hypothetical protein